MDKKYKEEFLPLTEKEAEIQSGTNEGISKDLELIKGHIPKIQALEEYVDTNKIDEWNIIIPKEEKSLHKIWEERVIKIIKDDIKPEQHVFLFYDESTQRFFLWANKTNVSKVYISEQLAYSLGFNYNTEEEIELNSIAKYSPDISGGLHTFYIYAPNLVENTIIGNQYGPLLRVINVDKNNKSSIVETIYTTEYHHKVILKQIAEIRIRILSDTGRPIAFNWGNCITTLHFKRSLF